MPPAMTPAPWIRTCAFRSPRPSLAIRSIIGVKGAAYSASTNDSGTLPKAAQGDTGRDSSQQEHVSEEAAKMAKITGGEGPDMDAGTPIQEIMQEEKDTRKDAPEVLKQDPQNGAANAKPSTTTGGRREFSTMARRRMEMDAHSMSSQPPLDPSMLPSASQRAAYQPATPISTDATKPGHKFPLPTLPLPPTARLHHRHDPIILQLTNLLMRDGKKSPAEKNMSHILNHLRTAPAPTYSPSRPLLPGAPPVSHLPLNPVLYLTLAIDSIAPLLRIRSQRGAAGGGVALQIPVPLGLRQRRRQAFQWILDAAGKRGSREHFAQRVANEIVGVVEGRSGIWERRSAVHRLGTTARSNLMGGGRGGRR
ncbi:hypothetical protein LTR37_010745 [Vermiconidia calcicola]|uniref:Uncharacterized protein n=1 Tax=Vermiconidia calcicola TaxID=1690605 RepID=A0ACC3N4S2_9PEZI|nr:hypothetical protein LTR37_010745 [Vermiconidia calcicola]